MLSAYTYGRVVWPILSLSCGSLFKSIVPSNLAYQKIIIAGFGMPER